MVGLGFENGCLDCLPFIYVDSVGANCILSKDLLDSLLYYWGATMTLNFLFKDLFVSNLYSYGNKFACVSMVQP